MVFKKVFAAFVALVSVKLNQERTSYLVESILVPEFHVILLLRLLLLVSQLKPPSSSWWQ